ncbi:MAG: HU domain-containing protein [Flavobacteriales bacterium]
MDFKYTRNLLPGMFLDYDCVIIPGLGGFVCNGRSAWYDEENEEMVPPSRDVIFSPNLIHNDGLLAQEIMRASDLTYSESMKHVDAEASQMIAQLLQGKAVEIPRVGRLYAGEDGVNRFLPDPELVRVLRSFGHARIPLSKLEEVALENSTKKAARIIPINSTLRVKIARVAAVIAVPIALGGAWMLSDESNSNTLLSVFPALNTHAIVSTFSPSNGSDLFESEESEVVEEMNIVYSTEEPVLVIEPVENAPIELVVPEVKAEVKTEVNFLIVGGAFSVEENAINLVSTLKKEGFNATLHFQNHNKLHLVALGEFETEVEARSALGKARKAGRKASWLKRL